MSMPAAHEVTVIIFKYTSLSLLKKNNTEASERKDS